VINFRKDYSPPLVSHLDSTLWHLLLCAILVMVPPHALIASYVDVLTLATSTTVWPQYATHNILNHDYLSSHLIISTSAQRATVLLEQPHWLPFQPQHPWRIDHYDGRKCHQLTTFNFFSL